MSDILDIEKQALEVYGKIACASGQFTDADDKIIAAGVADAVLKVEKLLAMIRSAAEEKREIRPLEYITPWRYKTECPLPVYPELKALLGKASHHFADDSAKEWPEAREAVEEAAILVINARLPFWAIKRMFEEIKPLVGFDSFISAMFTAIYRKKVAI